MESLCNCMLFAAGKAVSATGRVLVGHNEDDGGYMIVRHGYVPAAEWPEGTVLPAEPGCAAVPQAPHTLGYFWSEVKSHERGVSTSDTLYNECGVLVTSDSCMTSREDTNDSTRLTEGGVSYNLRRIVAERAHSAREALKIMIELVETWGYAPSARAYTVADKDEIFMMQIVSGKHYVAARVPDDMAVVMPNHYTFHRLDELPEMYYSADIISYAEEKGWYTPAVPGCHDDFDFARAYQSEKHWMDPVNVRRNRFGLERITNKSWADAESFPFAVHPIRKLTVEDMAAMLSDHFDGSECDRRDTPYRSPHDFDVRRTCTASTLEAYVCDFRDDPRRTMMWTAEGRPCQQFWLPVYPLVHIPEAFDPMQDPAADMARHLMEDREAVQYTGRGWQRFQDYGNCVEMVHGNIISRVDEVQKRFFADARVREAEIALSTDDTHLAEFSEGETARALGVMAEIEAEIRTGRILDSAPLSIPAEGEVTVAFSAPGNPAEDSLRLGSAHEHYYDQYAPAAPGSLRKTGENTYEARFPVAPLHKYAHPGLHRCFLGGQNGTATGFVAATLIRI